MTGFTGSRRWNGRIVTRCCSKVGSRSLAWRKRPRICH